MTGPVFETSIFSELVKRHGVPPVYFWRTTVKREIDFIVRLPETTLPLEVKLQFPARLPPVLETFSTIYPSDARQTIKPRLVALNGQPTTEGMIHPWQL